MESSLSQSRAGKYIQQISGYRSFIPADLPPTPAIDLGGKIQTLLSEADRTLGRLDGAVMTLPNPDLFVFMYVRKEAVLSSQIEGTQSSLQDLLAAEANVFTDQQPKDVDEVVNYVSAMRHGLSKLSELPVSVRLIREIHEKLLAGVRGSHLTPGEIRKTQNWIGPANCTLNQATFVPPPPDMVAESLSKLEQFLHSSSDLPLLIRIGLAHAQFETIHPFWDGNGRVGRLLITFLLCEQRALQKPVLYLSYFFKHHRQEYYERLQAVRDTGNWEAWLEFFLKGIAEVSRQATETARKILVLREEHRSLVTQHLGRGAGNGHRVLDSLFEHPITSVRNVLDMTKTSYPAANNLVNKLIELDILSEFTGQKRHRKFRYRRYIELFDDQPK